MLNLIAKFLSRNNSKFITHVIVTLGQKEKKKAMTTGLNFIIFTLNYFWQADWLIFMVNKRTDTSDFYLCKTRSFAERMPNFDACFFFS